MNAYRHLDQHTCTSFYFLYRLKAVLCCHGNQKSYLRNTTSNEVRVNHKINQQIKPLQIQKPYLNLSGFCLFHNILHKADWMMGFVTTCSISITHARLYMYFIHNHTTQGRWWNVHDQYKQMTSMMSWSPIGVLLGPPHYPRHGLLLVAVVFSRQRAWTFIIDGHSQIISVQVHEQVLYKPAAGFMDSGNTWPGHKTNSATG